MTGFSSRRMAGQMGVHHSEIYHLMRCLQATGMVDEHLRSFRHRKTTSREHWLIDWCARRNRFATSAHIRDELNFGGNVSIRNINIRSHDHLHWNICYCKNSPLVRQKLVFIAPCGCPVHESGSIETLTGT